MLTLVVIPTYNEAENLPGLIASIREHSAGAHVLVADDGSPDGTADVVDSISKDWPEVSVLRRSGARGYGRACMEGFRLALDRGYDRIISMDADWSHNPSYLPDLLGLINNGVDLAIGSRYCGNGSGVRNWPLRRILLSKFANFYVRALLRLRASDCTSGFRAYSAAALKHATATDVDAEGYAFLVEIATRVQRAGFNLKETPIIFVDRRAGQSKMSTRVMVESAIIPWKLLFRKYPLRQDNQ